jgi:hypothetical protein
MVKTIVLAAVVVSPVHPVSAESRPGTAVQVTVLIESAVRLLGEYEIDPPPTEVPVTV